MSRRRAPVTLDVLAKTERVFDVYSFSVELHDRDGGVEQLVATFRRELDALAFGAWLSQRGARSTVKGRGPATEKLAEFEPLAPRTEAARPPGAW